MLPSLKKTGTASLATIDSNLTSAAVGPPPCISVPRRCAGARASAEQAGAADRAQADSLPAEGPRVDHPVQQAGVPTNGVAVLDPTLPVPADQAPTDDQAAVAGAHVLLVEDNAINRELVLEHSQE